MKFAIGQSVVTNYGEKFVVKEYHSNGYVLLTYDGAEAGFNYALREDELFTAEDYESKCAEVKSAVGIARQKLQEAQELIRAAKNLNDSFNGVGQDELDDLQYLIVNIGNDAGGYWSSSSIGC